MKKKFKRIFDKRIFSHYQLLLLDDEDNDRVFSIKLNLINTLLVFSFFIILIITLTILALKYSPLKEYLITKENKNEYKNQLLKLNERVSGLEDSLAINNFYIKGVQAVVSGRVKAEAVDSLMARGEHLSVNSDYFNPTEEDSIFRAEIEKEEMEVLKTKVDKRDIVKFFTPLRGFVSSKYDLVNKHLAIDISTSEGESIKAIAEGEVLFSNWTPDTGFTLIVRHDNDVISMYKHCSKVYKREGDEVKKGEVIALVGNSGELTTGPHLHFELWIQGKAVDPQEYIDF